MSSFAVSRRRALVLSGGALVAPLAAPMVASGIARAADDWPNKPVRYINVFPPGGPTDTLSRIVCNELAEMTGQQFIVENKAGSGGNIGTDAIAKSAPDGYTIGLYTIASQSIAPTLYAKLSFDVAKDFTAIAMLWSVCNMLMTRLDLPAKTVPDLIKLVKASPGKYSFASSGAGTTPHITGELFKQLAQVNLLHVPYKGSAPGQVDVIAGRVPLMSDPLFSAMPFVRAGKLKVLAITTEERVPGFDQFPTVAETYPGFDVRAYLGFVVPKKTPTPVVKAIQSASARALQMPDLKKKIDELGNTPVGSSPEEFDRFIAADMKKWAKVIAEAKIPLE